MFQIIVSLCFVVCVFPSYCYENELSVVTDEALKVDIEQKNQSSVESVAKKLVSSGAFRPSKQLFDQIIYGHPSGIVTKRDEYSRALNNDQEEPQTNSPYGSTASAFNNLLVLPPQTVTYNLHETQDYFNSNKYVKDYGKLHEFDGIATSDAPKLNAKLPSEETGSLENAEQEKLKEFHYHKHKHLHQYDDKPDQPWQPLNFHNHERRPVYKNNQSNRIVNGRVKPHHQGEQYEYHNNGGGSKKIYSKNKYVHYSSKKYKRQQHIGNKIRHSYSDNHSVENKLKYLHRLRRPQHSMNP